MNDFFLIFTPLVEVLLIMQCLEITSRKKIRPDKYVVGLILLDVVLSGGINLCLIPRAFYFLLPLIMFVFCYRISGFVMTITVTRYILTFAIVASIEAGAAFIISKLTNQSGGAAGNFAACTLAFLIGIILNRVIHLIEKERLLAGNRLIILLAFACGLIPWIVVVRFIFGGHNIETTDMLIFILAAIMLICLYRLLWANNEIARKNYELEVQRIYGGAYEELLQEVRRKQHDYKNQLGAIHSMHLVANSLEELASMQKEYMEELQSDSKYDSILSKCDNAILAGYLYYRCISCQNEGVEVDYDILVEQAKCGMAVHEIIEILGILIDNACENFTGEQQGEKRIHLSFQEEEENIMFSVANPAKHKNFSEIGDMFEQGYSSKGENRGIGLARVRELVNQRGAELKVANVSHGGINWLEFTIELEKKKD